MSEALSQNTPSLDHRVTRTSREETQNSRLGPQLTIFLLVVITAAGAWVRFAHLGLRNLWLDEAYSVLFAHMPPGPFWKLMWSREGNMLAYYMLLRGWLHAGNSEFIVRAPSAVFGVTSIPVIYFLGRETFSKVVGLIAAALLSVHMFHVFLSQQARSYTLLMLLLLLSSWLFIRFVHEPSRRAYGIAYAVVSVISFYSHTFAVLVIASQWLSLNRGSASKLGRRRMAATLALIFVLALPKLAFLLLKNKGQVDWVPALNTHTFLDGLYAMTGYGGLALLIPYLLLVVAALLFTPESDEQAWTRRFIVLWAGFPGLILLLYSFHKPLFHSRFLIVSVPALILLAAQGAVALSRLWPAGLYLSPMLLVWTLAGSIYSTKAYVTEPACADGKPSTQRVLEQVQPHDAICFAGTGAEVFLYYMQEAKHLPWSELPNARYSHGVRCLADPPEHVADAGSPYQRAWLLKTDASPEDYAWISQRLTARFGAATIEGSFGCPAGKITVELLH